MGAYHPEGEPLDQRRLIVTVALEPDFELVGRDQRRVSLARRVHAEGVVVRYRDFGGRRGDAAPSRRPPSNRVHERSRGAAQLSLTHRFDRLTVRGLTAAFRRGFGSTIGGSGPARLRGIGERVSASRIVKNEIDCLPAIEELSKACHHG